MPFFNWGNEFTYAQMIQYAQAQALRAQTEPEDEGIMLNTFKVGCDPEFILLDGQGHTDFAINYFPRTGEIGYDHNGRVAEFRPEPTLGVYPIVRKIQKLIQGDKITRINRRLRGGAICNNDCLGGHVHFGFNAFTRKPPEGVGCLQGGQLSVKGIQVTKALDALTKVLEHLDILPKNESAQRRTSAQGQGNYYGAYGDVRDCHGHMEYRTMASWLYDPKIAFLCLTAAKLAACDPEGTVECLKDCTSFGKFEEWLSRYKGKDLNATRATEKLLDRGQKFLQVDPEVDFRERWERLGI